MRKPRPLPAVLIVEEDLGFLGWLGDLFTEAGYRALPALNCRQAISMIKKFKFDVDVIAVDEGLPGVPAMIGMLKRSHRPLKIVAIRDPTVEGREEIAAHATLERPSGWEPISRSDWLLKVLQVLKQAQAKAVG